MIGVPALLDLDDERLADWLGPVFAYYLTCAAPTPHDRPPERTSPGTTLPATTPSEPIRTPQKPTAVTGIGDGSNDSPSGQ